MVAEAGKNTQLDAAMHPAARLYRQFLDSWNERDAQAMAALFEPQALLVGFDGSAMAGSGEIERTIGAIFADHQTMPYVALVRAMRELAPGSALLHAVAGMPFRGQATINPAVNAVQSLVAVQHGGEWRIALLQTTPAQYHGRPEATEALTDELQQILSEATKDGSERSS